MGEIKWTPGNPASFYLKGTVFIDGNISTSTSAKVDYTGRGTIYANGSISIGNSLAFCGARSNPKCNYTTGAWDPEQAGRLGRRHDDRHRLVGRHPGSVLRGDGLHPASSASVQGPIVANNIFMNSSSQAKWLPFNTLPGGLPGGSSAYSVAVLPGTWKG